MSAGTFRSLLGLGLVLLALVGGCATSSPQPFAVAGWQGRAPNSPDAFRFVILSDRTGGHIPGDYEKAVAEVNLLRPDFVMCVGDLIEGYNTDEQVLTKQWQEIEDILSRLDAPFFYAPGNHDVAKDKPQDPDSTRNIYQRRHGVLGKTYYSFKYRGCHFLILNTPTAGLDPAFAAEQRSFIEKDLANVGPTEHVFVFTHYPVPDNKTVWPTLKTMLPKGRSTVFTGHLHSLGYEEVDGIPAYVLASTAAHTDGSAGSEHMFGYVAVDHGVPTISFIPTGQIRPAAYAPAVVALRDIMRASGIPGVHAEGGIVTVQPNNAGKLPVTIDYQFLAADWEITPTTAQLIIAPGESAKATFTLKPLSQNPANPSFIQQCSMGGFTTSQQGKLPVSYRGTLGQIAQLRLDGLADEWAAIPAVEISTPGLLFEGRDLWRGPMDSSCRFRAAIAGDRLAMLIEVTDDQINTDQKEAWTNDAVEICWDLRPAGTPEAGMTAGTGQMAFVPADTAGPAKLTSFVPAMKFGTPMPASLQSFTRRTADGYTIEISVPVTELGAVAGANISGINLAVCLDDRDMQGKEAVTKRFSITGTGEFWRSPAGYARFVGKP